MIRRLKENKNKIILTMVAIFLFFILALSSFYIVSDQSLDYDKFPGIQSSDRVLIVSPHPDDESLANSGIIRAALEANATVLVVMMTVGDATPIDVTNYTKQTNRTDFNGTIGELRHLETVNAMEQLGLNQSSIIFLGYPDGGLNYLFETNWDSDNPYNSSSPGNKYNHSPYNFSYELNAAYSGANVDKNLEEIIRNFRPTVIFYPDDGDEHPDHWATSAFVRYVAIKTNYTGEVYTYLVHKGPWPTPLSYQPNLRLEAPSDVLRLDATWYRLELTKENEDRKRSAISSHITQMYLMKDYLMAFVRVNEIFARYQIIEIDGTDDANFTSGMPLSSFDDLKYDSKTSLLLPSTDLAGAGMAYDKENMYLLLRTSGLIDDKMIYTYHLRIYNGTDFKRIDIEVANSTAQYELFANNSIESTKAIDVQKKGDILIVNIPLNLFENVDLIMMSTTIKDADKNTMDSMSWRVFEFINEF